MKILKFTTITAVSFVLAAACASEPAQETEQAVQQSEPVVQQAEQVVPETEEVSQDKPSLYSSQSMNLTATVEAVDHETRVVTLRGPEGNSVTFTADDEVRNLAQVEVGDIVDVEYLQSVSIEVVANPGLEPAAGEIAAAGRAELGEMPGMAIMDSKVVTATVEDINIEANTFKLKWPDESVEEFVAENPDNLKKAEVGDLVIITYTEALAISVEHARAE